MATLTKLVDCLAGHGDGVALIDADRQLTYRELADRVATTASQLGPSRRLVLILARNDIETIVGYLAAHAAGHVVLLTSADSDLTALTDTYDPDVVVDRGHIDDRRATSAHDLHPELALLLSTSGSTGSPKLVRLSHANLLANATSIAQYLNIGPTDRAMTSLPLSYCYGLSVLHSHLIRGAGVIVTDHSVVDPQFWTLFTDHRATNLAGVPYTFDLLDSIGFDRMDLPNLRYLTQAGGKLAPDRVSHYAALGELNGWQFFAMYGATEATARMAYLPPDLAKTHPNAIGVAIPGGALTIDPSTDDSAVGELVYFGPNVMLGYAESAADLALGRTVDTLRTGDLAQRTEDGLFEIVGRANRFAKLFGLRIDLARIETLLADRRIAAFCADGNDEVIVAVSGNHDVDDIRRFVARSCGLPPNAVRVCTVDELPRSHSGKPDYGAVKALATLQPDPHPTTDVRALFSEVLHLAPSEVTDDATFVSLGGDSLTYVTMSIRLEEALGWLPTDWHTTPIGTFRRRTSRSFGRTVEMSVVLRAAAIVLVVGSHIQLFEMWGGAHILLGLAGYNFARFVLPAPTLSQRTKRIALAAAGIAIPSMLWIALALLFTNEYAITNLFLLNKILGPDGPTQGHLWFVEVLVFMLVGVAALMAIPWVDRLERLRPFWFALGVLAIALAMRYDVLGLDPSQDARRYTVLAFWFFALGWAAAKAPTTWHRMFIAAIVIVTVPGYFDDNAREVLVIAGLLLLVAVPSIRVPVVVAPVAAALASASLFVYLTHWQIYPLFGDHRLIALAASLAFGIALHAGYRWALARVTSRVRARTYRTERRLERSS